MKQLVNIFAAMLFFCLALSLPAYALQGDDYTPRKVRVGYTDYYNFIQKTESGEFSGYGVDYLQEIARYTNWNYEYVYCEWGSVLDKLQSGEVDLMCNATQSRRVKEDFSLSQYSIGIEQFVLYCLPETDLYFDDFEGFDGKLIGVIEGSANSHFLKEYSQRNGFSFTPIYFTSDDAMEKALYDGEVDIISTVHLAPYDNLKLIAKHGSNPIYILTANNSGLYPSLVRALSAIKSDTPEFDGALYKKYYSNSLAATQPMFTRQEHDFIQKCAPVKVAIWSDRIPISFVNSKTGEPSGINYSLLNELGKISGLTFEYVPITQNIALTDTLLSGETRIVCGPPDLGDYFKNSNFRISTPYFTSKMVFVGRSNPLLDTENALRVAAPKTAKATNYYLSKEYPNLVPVPVDSILEGFYSVFRGDADVIMCDEYLASYYLQKPAFSKLKAFSGYSIVEPEVIVGLNGDDPTLMSVINKSISVLPKETVEDIVIAQIANASYVPNASDTLYQYGVETLLLAFIVALCFFLVIKISDGRKKSALSLKKINDQLSLQQKRYELVMSQTKDIIFEWNYQTKEIEYSKNFELYLQRTAVGEDFPVNPKVVCNIHPDDVDTYLELYRSYDKGALCAVGEYRLKNREDAYFWCRSRSSAVVDENGKIITVIGVLSDINSEKNKLLEIENLAKKDTLTGLYNRRTAEALIQNLMADVPTGALFIIDIDDFKSINDTMGHSAGDDMLISVADALSALFRDKDIVARLGGDEFIVYMPGVWDEEPIRRRAQTIVDKVSRIECSAMSLSISAGIAFYPKDGDGFIPLYKNADQALYRAKNNGKNQFAI
ncbi:MAG: diguanylate cyclase [Oscillospiraceae bacterium]